MARWLPLLVLYNAVFVLPPVLFLVGHIVFGRRLDARYADLRERLQTGARETMLWIFGLVGGALLVSSVRGVHRPVRDAAQLKIHMPRCPNGLGNWQRGAGN